MNTSPALSPPAPAPAAGAAVVPTAEAVAPPTWRSEDLLGGAQEVRITHGNVVYTLRHTKTGKLILVK